MSPSGLVNGPRWFFSSKNVPFLTAHSEQKFININQLLVLETVQSVNILCVGRGRKP